MSRSLKAFAALSAVAALSLAGCSFASDTDADSSADDDTAVELNEDILATDLSGVAKDEKIAALVPEEVSKDGKLTIGDNIYYAPAEFYAPDGETAQGYDIDLMKAIAAVMGLEADIQQSEFDSILPGIPTKYEMGMANFTATAERQANYDMIQYFAVGSSWVTQKGNPKDFSADDICGTTIGVQTGTVQDEAIVDLAEACGDNAPTVERMDEQSQVTTKLAGGQLDAMYCDSSVADYAVFQTGDVLEVASTDEGTDPIAAVTEKDSDMTKAVQAALQKLMDDGTVAKVFETWGIAENVSTEAVLNPAK